ncbi:hypothetical protein CO726_13480 [Bacillus fungorum]|uniref:Uncharacterized protein n=1 Tax=Bacillus fungorum TaxID=2039284 RepID=A0A2G6QCN3_9BACI|nr:hypothetical protein [Bacillus fungorum]PIE94593.1 hypothetical protein CO726_13480 [Bacillus fungorum]
MDNKNRLMLISGVTNFAFYDYNSFPEINCYNYYTKYINQIYNEVKTVSYSRYSERNLNFNFINRFDINGIAFIKDNDDYVHINEGALYKVYKKFSELVISGAFSEYTYIKQVANCQVNLENEEVTEEQFIYKIPDDYNGKLISEYLSMFAMKFIILHELGHHINGHLLYIKEKYGVNSWYTRGNRQNVPDVLIRTLEMDADAFAISQLVREFQELIINDSKFSSLAMPNEIKLGLFIFAIHVLFIILGEGIEPDVSSSKYMIRKARYVYNISCLETNLKLRYSEFYASINFDYVTSYYWVYTEKLYHKVFGVDNKLIEDMNKVISDFRNLDEMEKTWNSIHDELFKFARIPIASKYVLSKKKR